MGAEQGLGLGLEHEGGSGGGSSARDEPGDPRPGPGHSERGPLPDKTRVGFVQAMDWDYEQQAMTATYAPCSACGGVCVGHVMR